jgi:nitrite reductase/ring-hydroxylating ferredoxin subunit
LEGTTADAARVEEGGSQAEELSCPVHNDSFELRGGGAAGPLWVCEEQKKEEK